MSTERVNRHWRSLREADDPTSLNDVSAREFAPGVTDNLDLASMTPISRKRFLALLAASSAFAVAGCTNYRDKGEIVPYTRQPQGEIPGVANAYASTCTGCHQACGTLVKTREGRPIKIDGNPDHPTNRGAVCPRGQASVLNLYDPNRLRKPQRGTGSGRSGELSWEEADRTLAEHLTQCVAAGREIALITRPVYSPTGKRVLETFAAAFPTTAIYAYDTLHDESRRRAWQRVAGEDLLPVVEWERARVVLALESDFLGTDGMSVEAIRRFTAARDPLRSDELNRLYVVEGDLSASGANADYRLRLRPDAQVQFLLGLLHELAFVRRAIPLTPDVRRLAAGCPLAEVAQQHGLRQNVLDHLITDLLEHRGRAILVAGSLLEEDVHVLVHFLNDALGNSRLYARERTIPAWVAPSPDTAMASLVHRMRSGEVGAVIHLDANPVYDLPSELNYAESLEQVPVTVSLAEAEDETGALCSHVLPIHNQLESWGDYQRRTRTLSLQQPVIAPLYDTRQKEGVLLAWAGTEPYAESVYHEFLMGRWRTEVYPSINPASDFRTFWLSSLHDGVITHVGPDDAPMPAARSDALARVSSPETVEAFALMLTSSPFLGDGRFANNGWLQELPHPVSKIVWDNYASLSAATAERLEVSTGETIEVLLPHGRATLPVSVQPGLADNLIAVSLGYGRWNAGPIGTHVGTFVHQLLSRDALSSSRVYRGVSVTKAGGTYQLVSTQEHHALDDAFVKDLHRKRHIIQEGTLEEYRQNPHFLHEEPHDLFSISKEVTYEGLKWAMAIDMNKCVGCNVCVSACNVENNVPVVGKDQVHKGREMQWIRIDRYFSGTAEDPVPSHQPMLCQHCDNAPCENVCPVVATQHSPDGLNQMVYNRCVGTKYCSNNCPYKVRRFNFYNFRDNLADGYYEQEPVSLVHNPEVTVRSRGVMEKCTFCVQRISEARQVAAQEGRGVRGSDVTTACQEACPARAIVFGDMNDPNSEVSRYRTHGLGYHVLAETNVRPNVTYLARLRNIHAEKVL
jgi:Fe-S-cluster-containing dehydrogenase component